MNKMELIAKVSETTGMTKKEAEKAVVSALNIIMDTVAEGEKVQLVGFGIFEQRVRKERIGSDPRTGERITIGSAKVPTFKFGKVFKQTVAEK